MVIACMEDDAVFGQLLQAILEAEFDARVLLFADGDTGLAALAAEPHVDLVLLDAGLAGTTDGLSVCRRIQHHPILRSVRIIFLTARKDADFLQQASRLGVPVLGKPIQPRTFADEIRVILAGTKSA